jgi:hypothetical protein
VIHYGVTLTLFAKATHNRSHQITPPVVPHFFSFIGIVPWLAIFLESYRVLYIQVGAFLLLLRYRDITVLTRRSYYTPLQHPVRIKLSTKKSFIIQGREHVVADLAQTSTSNTIFNSSFLRQACDMSDNAVERLGSETEEMPKYFRLKYPSAAPLYSRSSSVVHRYLAGRTALQLSQRFENNPKGRFEAHQGLNLPEGVVLDNFLDFFSNDVTAALLNAMRSKGLLERNPAFTRAFWTFCDNLPTFMKRTPRFLAPNAYAAREEVLAAVVDWQTWASKNFNANTTPLDEDGNDPLWGSAFFREKFSTFVYDMGFDVRDMASMELGFLFGCVA